MDSRVVPTLSYGFIEAITRNVGWGSYTRIIAKGSENVLTRNTLGDQAAYALGAALASNKTLGALSLYFGVLIV